jgi:hypothetical protein
MRVLSLFSIMGLLACSGASSTDVDGPVAGGAASTEVVSSGTERPKEAGKPSTEAADPDAPPSKPPVTEDPVDRTQECATEVEGNDTAAKATKFSSCIAGVLKSAHDEDYVTFTAPDDAERMTISHQETNGRVVYNVFRKSPAGDVPIPAGTFTEDAPPIRLIAGATYYVRMSAPMWGDDEQDGKRDWELRIAFE